MDAEEYAVRVENELDLLERQYGQIMEAQGIEFDTVKRSSSKIVNYLILVSSLRVLARLEHFSILENLAILSCALWRLPRSKQVFNL